MAKMTNAQLAAENAALRAALDDLRMEHSALREVTQRDYVHFNNEIERLEQVADTYRIERDELRSELADLRKQRAAAWAADVVSAIPAWQLGAQQRRAQYDAAVAQGRRVKFVGNVLVDY